MLLRGPKYRTLAPWLVGELACPAQILDPGLRPGELELGRTHHVEVDAQHFGLGDVRRRTLVIADV